jgi:hypothetical protein
LLKRVINIGLWMLENCIIYSNDAEPYPLRGLAYPQG